MISSRTDDTRGVTGKMKVRRHSRISPLSGSYSTRSDPSALSGRGNPKPLVYARRERRAIDDVDLQHLDVIRVLGAKNNIRVGVVKELDDKTSVCRRCRFRSDGIHGPVVSCRIKI